MATSDSNSDDNSSKDDGSNGNTDDSSSSGGGPNGSGGPAGSSIGDLTSGMKTLKEKAADLKLSPEARKACTDMLKNYRQLLESQRSWMDLAADIPGNVGKFNSAQQTKQNLLYNINGPDGAKDIINKCIEYLDELEATVGKSADKMMHAG